MIRPDAAALRRIVLAVAATSAMSVSASAQSLPPAPSPSPGLFSNYSFWLSADSLRSSDRRFNWDARFGGEIDIVDYGYGRLNLLAAYQTVLGEELRRFDPNQSNYTFDVLSSLRLGGTEIAAVLHHVSRHLSDRAKQMPIDWNMAGVQAARIMQIGPVRVAGHGRMLWTFNRSFVDYRSRTDLGVSGAYAALPQGWLIGSVSALIIGTGGVADPRGTLVGGRTELGVRIIGRRAAVEVFGGYEERVDADPFERRTRGWPLVGFRLINQ